LSFNFYDVNIIKSGSKYTINSISPSVKKVEVGMQRAGDSCSPPDPEIFVNMDDNGAIVSRQDFRNIPVDEHSVVVTSYSGQTMKGVVNMTSFTPSGASPLNVYAPVLEGFTSSDAGNILRLYAQCGLSPLSFEINATGKVGCSWTG
jgi:hypothetical protein